MGLLIPPFHLITLTILLILSSPPSSYLYLQPQSVVTASTSRHDNTTDLQALLHFRSLADPHGFLSSNWTTSASFCHWDGVLCSRRRQRVTSIRLYNISLQGTISPHLGNLSFLSVLYLSNLSLTGHVPQSIGYLPRLRELVLQRNSLSGHFPPNIFNMSSMLYLYVATNNLSGSLSSSNNSFTMPPGLREISLANNRFTGIDILSSLLQCPDIQIIALNENQFSGPMPADLGSLSELLLLNIVSNLLTGSIPSSLGNLTKLNYLNIADNLLTGSIPSSLGNLTKLTSLLLEYNNLSGIIPKELGNLSNLQKLLLNSNFNIVGSIPASMLNLSMLIYFDLSHNKLTGSVPGGIGKSMPMLRWFNVGFNQLSGGLEFLSSLSNCKKLQYLQIDHNILEGVLQDSVGNLSASLIFFTAFENRIKGNIPSTLGNLSGLIDLELGSNELTGRIPSTLAKLESLEGMILSFNNISGLIPSELGEMKKLNKLFLQDNKLFGPIPKSLGNVSTLQYLYLSKNNLSANIPESLCTSASLLKLELSRNNLSGSLPSQVGSLKTLTFLDLSFNHLSGSIPDNLGELSMLEILNLSKNSFQGQIPKSFGELISATYINLSYNNFSGSIPRSLANLSYLNIVDLSFNKLEGQIPEGRVFSNSSIPSLIGNKALCGAPQLHILPCNNMPKNNSKRKVLPLKYVLLATILGMALLMSFFLIYAFHSKRKLKSLPDTNTPRLDLYRVISHHELVRATENFSEANLIGRGGFALVFRGCLDDGLVVAIKVLNLDVEGSLKSFEAECQVLGMVRHKNLIKIISACSHIDFKALILEYMPNGSLERWLYSENHFLNLIQRLDIMVDVSLALEYLHHHHPQVVLHCDLKPTNILLDEELSAYVSDFGIAKLLLGDSKSRAATSLHGTIGYIAPEYATSGIMSRMSDVYGFGILLLEMITGKKPTSVFGEQLNLREWISKAHSNMIMDIMDQNILKFHDTNNDLQKLLQCVTSVIKLGLLCSNYSPKERMPMTDITTRLQKIKIEYLSSSVAPTS